MPKLKKNKLTFHQPEIKYEFHHHANWFGLMNKRQFAALIEDIERNGLRESIKLIEGKILDGRNRYLACLQVNIEPVFESITVSNTLDYVISHNLTRNDLSQSQKAMLAAKATFPEHAGSSVRTPRQASVLTGASKRSVDYAKAVISKGIPSLTQAVVNGLLPVDKAAAIAKYDNEEQLRLLELDRRRLNMELKQASRDNVQNCTLEIQLSQEALEAVTSTIHKTGAPGTMNDLIELAVTEFCRTFKRVDIKAEMAKAPFEMPDKPNERYDEVVNGISQYEKDCERFEDENGRRYDPMYD